VVFFDGAEHIVTEPFIFAYTRSADGNYLLRIFWKSLSGGDWRFTPAFYGGHIDKGNGISYTQDTQIDPD